MLLVKTAELSLPLLLRDAAARSRKIGDPGALGSVVMPALCPLAAVTGELGLPSTPAEALTLLDGGSGSLLGARSRLMGALPTSAFRCGGGAA